MDAYFQWLREKRLAEFQAVVDAGPEKPTSSPQNSMPPPGMLEQFRLAALGFLAPFSVSLWSTMAPGWATAPVSPAGQLVQSSAVSASGQPHGGWF